MPIRSKTVKANEVEHPGVILDKVLKERGISQKDLSDAIGKSTPVVNDIIKKRRSISPEIAYMLEVVIDDIPADEWLSYQSQYDLAMIRKDEAIAKRRKSLEEWNQLKTVFNTSYLKKKLGLTGTPEENVDKVYKFFGVASVAALEEKATSKVAYFKQSTTLQVDPANMMTWILMVRKRSSDTPSLKAPYDTKMIVSVKLAYSVWIFRSIVSKNTFSFSETYLPSISWNIFISYSEGVYLIWRSIMQKLCP